MKPGAPHGPGLGTQAAVFAALLALTAVTTWIAFVDLGPLNTPAALAIASAKAALVMIYFMHLTHSPRLVWAFAISGFLWLALLLGGVADDSLTRGL